MEEIKLPKNIVKELIKASDYTNKSENCIQNFMRWVIENVDEDFDFDTLRATSESIDMIYQTEALTEIEYENEIDTNKIERVLNIWIRDK